MILGRDLLTALGLDHKFSDNFIIVYNRQYGGCLAPMIDVSNYYFTSLADKRVKTKEFFINSYIYKCLKSESAIILMRRMHRIIYAKDENSDLNKFITKQRQHLNAAKCIRILAILKRFKDLFNGTLGTCNSTPVDLELKDNAKLVCL